MDEQEQHKKSIPTRKYVSCPICSKVLLQGELVKNTLVKCENCHRRIFVEIENGKTIANIYNAEKE